MNLAPYTLNTIRVEDKGPYAFTPNTVELIHTLGAFPPRGGPVQDPVLTKRAPLGWYPRLRNSNRALCYLEDGLLSDFTN